MIYLDYNATTPLAPEVLAAMQPFLAEHFGNPSSIHRAGREARAAVDSARDRLATVLQTKSHELIFTGGGTESANLAVLGLARSHSGKGRHLITSQTEHHAVLHAFAQLEKRENFRVTWLPVDRAGRIDPQQLQESIGPETTLVSIMAANNETGTLQPVQEISRICRERAVLFHSDAIQAFGKIPLRSADFDALSLAGHKFHGPKGSGLLFLRSGISLENLQFGGSHENQRRPGTENVAGIVGLATAAELALHDLSTHQLVQQSLRDQLWTAIQSAQPSAIRNGDPAYQLANTLNVSFPQMDGESLLMNLDLAGICASSGSACMVGSILPSHVLLAMGLSPLLAKSSVRFSLGKFSSQDEITRAGSLIHQLFAR